MSFIITEDLKYGQKMSLLSMLLVLGSKNMDLEIFMQLLSLEINSFSSDESPTKHIHL